ncbi:MAG: rhomboid family intramembrane serine protease [Pseudomonadota bacterium]
MDRYRVIRPQSGPPSAIPTVIFALLVINGVAFAAQNLLAGQLPLIGYLALWSLDSGLFLPFQLLTYGFLHGNLWHLALNLFMLWMFGRNIEHVWGQRRFLIYYLVCVVGAGLTQLVVGALQGGAYPTVGASGGVFGLLLAYGMLFPEQRIMLLFPPIPLKAKYMVVLFGLFTLAYGISGAMPGVAHFAHLGGMVFGLALILVWRRR